MYVNPRMAGGGYPPSGFSQIAKKKKTAARSAAKFAITVKPNNLTHLQKKKR